MAEARVFITKFSNEAQFRVFLVDYESQEKNAQLISPGKLVQYASEANVRVFIVNYENEAQIKITRGHFPK